MEARLAVVETLLREAADDRAQMTVELERARGRLHLLESQTAALNLTAQLARQAEDRQYRRLELRLEWLMLVATLVGVLLTGALIFVAVHFGG